jgi:histidyl-tRNA synthetase
MKRANRINAANVLIVGSQEIEAGAVVLRNMATKEQVTIPIDGMVNHIKKHLAS